MEVAVVLGLVDAQCTIAHSPVNIISCLIDILNEKLAI